RFTKDHEWVSYKDGVGTFGISDYAQKALGDVVYVEVPSVGDHVSQKDAIGVVESVKAASDVYAPISGEIVEINESLAEEPSKINQSPLGWIAKIKLSNPDELKELMDEAQYKAFAQ
ncbi:glycine cleavage system protein H, partial [Gorgonomyces haynaldii]